MAINLQFSVGVNVRLVAMGAVLTGEACEDEMLRLSARFNASLSIVPHVSSLVVEEEGWLLDCLRRDVCGECPITVNHVDYAVVLDLILKSSQKTFLSPEASSVLDHFQWRLKSLLLNKLPKLRSVSVGSSDCWVHLVEGGGA